MILNKIINNKVINYLYKLQKKNNHHKINHILILNDWIGINALVNGFYEKDELDILINSINKDLFKKSVVDVGANIGNHSLFFSNYFNKVLSFEPQNFIFKVLELNVINNNNIKIFNFGLGESNSLLTFHIPYKDRGMASQFPKNDDSYIENVTIKRYDDLFLGEEIGLVKIDTEGNELSVIKGMEKAILSNQPILYFELNRDSTSRMELLNHVTQLGYDFFYVNSQKFFPYNIRFLNYLLNQPKIFKRISIDYLLDTKFNHNVVIATTTINRLKNHK